MVRLRLPRRRSGLALVEQYGQSSALPIAPLLSESQQVLETGINTTALVGCKEQIWACCTDCILQNVPRARHYYGPRHG